MNNVNNNEQKNDGGCSCTLCTPPRSAPGVKQNQLLYLRELNFTWSNIAKIFGVSRSSLYRIRKEVGLQNLPKYSCISDEDL